MASNSVEQGDKDLAMLKLIIEDQRVDATISSITVRLTGTCSESDVEEAGLIQDVDNNGYYSGADKRLAKIICSDPD